MLTLIVILFLSAFSGLNSIPGKAPVGLQRNSIQKSARKWEPQKRTWKTAVFKGLKMGKSTTTDMLKLLGKPTDKEVFKNSHGTIVWYHYNDIGEVPGEVTVEINKRNNLIKTVYLYPRDLSKEEAISFFGNHYIVTRYDFDACLRDRDSAPLYESSDGSVEFIEYRERGIALSLDSNNSIDNISYVSVPIGSKRSKCKKKRRD